MDTQFTMQEIAQMLGERDLLIATLNKQIVTLNERHENLLKQKDEIYNELHALKLKIGSYPQVVSKIDIPKEAKA